MYVDSVRRVHNSQKNAAGTPIITRGDILPVLDISKKEPVVLLLLLLLWLQHKGESWPDTAGQQHQAVPPLNNGPIKGPLIWLWRYNRVNISAFRQAQKIYTLVPSVLSCLMGNRQTAGPCRNSRVLRLADDSREKEPIIILRCWPVQLHLLPRGPLFSSPTSGLIACYESNY